MNERFASAVFGRIAVELVPPACLAGCLLVAPPANFRFVPTPVIPGLIRNPIFGGTSAVPLVRPREDPDLGAD